MNDVEKMFTKEISMGNLVFSIIFLALTLAAVAFLVFFVIRLFKSLKEGNLYEIHHHQQQLHNNAMNKKMLTKTLMNDQHESTLKVTQMIDKNKDKIQIGLSSIIGTRKYQQDAVIACSKAYLRKNNFRKGIVVLCDGMGGMNGGELASTITSKKIYEDYLRSNPTDIPKFLKEEVKKVDTLVYELKDEKNRPLGSGCTMLCIVIDDDKLFWVSVGDSRIYLIRNEEIVQITEDHNYYSILKKKADSGLLSYEEAANDPRAEALISFIGIGKDSPIDNNEQPFPLQDEDIILLCSDGLYKTLSNEEILSTIRSCSDDVENAAKMLTTVVQNKQRKGQDNTTVSVVKFLK